MVMENKGYRVTLEIDGRVYLRIPNRNGWSACPSCPVFHICHTDNWFPKVQICGNVHKWCFDKGYADSRAFVMFDRYVSFRPSLINSSEENCGLCIFKNVCLDIQKKEKHLPCERDNVAAGYYHYVDK